MTIEFKRDTIEKMEELEFTLSEQDLTQIEEALKLYNKYKDTEDKSKDLKKQAERIMDEVYDRTGYVVTSFNTTKGTIYLKENMARETLDKAKLITVLVSKGVDIDLVNECIKKATKKSQVKKAFSIVYKS